VTEKLARTTGSSEEDWVAIDGSAVVVNGDLSEISDGDEVKIDSAK
jgi:hypothetical protein